MYLHIRVTLHLQVTLQPISANKFTDSITLNEVIKLASNVYIYIYIIT